MTMRLMILAVSMQFCLCSGYTASLNCIFRSSKSSLMFSIQSPDWPTATFPKICNGLLFRSIPRMCLQNWNFVALPLPEIIGGTLKIRKSLHRLTLPFHPNFKGAFVRMNPVNIPAKFEIRSFTRS